MYVIKKKHELITIAGEKVTRKWLENAVNIHKYKNAEIRSNSCG